MFGISVYHYDYVIEQSTAIDNEMTYAYLLFSFSQKITEPFTTIEKETQYWHHHVLQSHHHVIHIIACLPRPSILTRLTLRLRTSLASGIREARLVCQDRLKFCNIYWDLQISIL